MSWQASFNKSESIKSISAFDPGKAICSAPIPVHKDTHAKVDRYLKYYIRILMP